MRFEIMSYHTMAVLLIVISLSYIFILFFARKKVLVYFLIAITLSWGILGGLGFTYLTNPQLSLSIDVILKPVSEHKSEPNNLTDEVSPPLPLPKNTAFAYRYSLKGASYYTTLSSEEIIIFFKSIASVNSYSEGFDTSNGGTTIALTYKDNPYSIKVLKCIKPEGYYLHVYSN